MGDLVAAERSVLLEHTVVVENPSTYDYTMAVVQTVVVVQTVILAVMVKNASTAVVYTAIKVVAAPPVAAVVA